MSLYASIDSVQIVDARIVVPKLGAWYADLTLATEKTITGTHTLAVADLSWKCTVWRGAPYQGRTRLRVIGGGGGWQRQIPAKSYKADVGVKLSTVLTDAARECREIGVEIVSDRTIGLFCVRDVAPAARILNRLAREWHVRADGKTIVGPWATLTPIAERFDLVAFDGSAGRAELAGSGIERIAVLAKQQFGLRGRDLEQITPHFVPFSAKNTERPAFQRMARLIKSGQDAVTAVVVTKLDRLTRSLRDLLSIYEDLLEPNDCNFVAIRDGKMTTFSGSGATQYIVDMAGYYFRPS